MATKTFFLNSNEANYGEEEFNHVQKFFFDEGVLNTQGTDWEDWVDNGDLKVNERGAGQNMSVDVQVGNALVETTRSGQTFKVFVFSTSVENLTVPNNTSGSNRVDAVILRVDRDGTPNALMNNIATLEYITGTNGASAMSDAQIQTALGDSDDFIRLADITVVDSETLIQDSDIADTRSRAQTTDQVNYAPELLRFRGIGSDPATANLQGGDFWFNNVTNKLKFYDGTAIIEINNVVYTGGDGVDITSNVLKVDLDTGSGLEFNAGKLKLVDTILNLGKKQYVASEAFADNEVGIIRNITESHEAGTADRACGASSGDLYVSQGFQVPSTQKVYRGEIRAKIVGSPTADLRVHIYSDDAGDPDASLGSFDIPVELLTTSYQWLSFAIDAGVSLTADTQYHIVVTTSNASVDGSNFFNLESETTGTYTYGSTQLSADATTWSADGTRDLKFKMYYVGVGKADNDVAEEIESGEIVVADGAISARAVGDFVYGAVKSGFNFDLFDATEKNIYDVTTDNTNETMTTTETFQFITNDLGGGTLKQITGVKTEAVSSPDGNVEVRILLNGTQVGATITKTSNATNTYDFYDLQTNINRGDEIKIGVKRTTSTGTVQLKMNTTAYAPGSLIRAGTTLVDKKIIGTVVLAQERLVEIGDYIYTDTVAGGYDLASGTRCVGKIISQDEVLIGEKPKMEFRKSGSQVPINDTAVLENRIPVPVGADMCLLTIEVLAPNGYGHTSTLTVTRNGKTASASKSSNYTLAQGVVEASWDGNYVTWSASAESQTAADLTSYAFYG